jgi:tetratricopeptide (TPR) repeat protein
LAEIQDLANGAIAQMNLSIVYSLSGQTTKALEMYALAESTFRRLHDLYNLAKVLTCEGLDYLVLSDWVQAERAFIASATLFQEIGDIDWRLNALDGLGLAYLGQNQFEKAGAIFQSALAELPQIVGTPMYDYLAAVLPDHLTQARQKEKNSQERSH